MATQVTVTAQSDTQYNVTINTGSEAQAEYWASIAEGFADDADSSASASATSESNALTSANNAATSEDNAADAAEDAEKHAQSTGSFTDSDGAAFDKGAKGYKEDAEAARDEITGEIDFTGLQEGDVLYHDGNKLVKSNIIEPASFSALNTLFQIEQIFTFDNFNRPDVLFTSNAALLGPSDAGEDYSIVSGEFGLNNNRLRHDRNISNVSLMYVEKIISGGYKTVIVETISEVGTSGGACNLIGLDNNNYIYSTIDQQRLALYKVIQGVTTLVSQVPLTTSRYRFTKFKVDLLLHHNTNKQELFVNMKIDDLNIFNQHIFQVNGPEYIALDGDLKCGIGLHNVTSGLLSYTAKSLGS